MYPLGRRIGRAYAGLGVGQTGKRLIALGGEQQPFQIPTELIALTAVAEQVIKSVSIGFKGTRRRRDGQIPTS